MREIKRRVVEERKIKERIVKLEKRTQELQDENQRLRGSIKKMKEDMERIGIDKNLLKWEEVDRKKTLVLKNGRNWRKEERVEKWVTRHIGEVDFEVKKMDKGQEGIQWIVFKETFVKDYLWYRRDKVNREGIFTIDEVLGTEERKKRWEERERERLERLERDERRRGERGSRPTEVTDGSETEKATSNQTGDGDEMAE